MGERRGERRRRAATLSRAPHRGRAPPRPDGDPPDPSATPATPSLASVLRRDVPWETYAGASLISGPEVVALRRMISDGTLGTMLQIEANFSQDKFFALPKDNWRLSNRHAPVGPLTATGIHLVDLSIAVLGPCESVWARLATRGSDFENGDTLAVMMAFPQGANAMISAVLATPFEGRFAVYGSKGWVEIRDRTHPENPTGWDITVALRGQPRQTRFAEPAPSVLLNLEAFARAVRGVEPYPVSTSEMLANVASLEAIMTSVSVRKPVTVTQP